MVPIKTLLSGLFGVSLCIADISGIVTDTGTTLLAGAVVQLEKGGQTATTGADGSFTLVVSTAILPGDGKPLLAGLFKGISGTTLNVMIAERTVVEVATFDISGKSLSIILKTLDAGSRSLSLPYHGAGIYLYKVKVGNSEIVLKGNTVSGAASGSALSSRSSASNHVAKQAMNAAVFNDVIAATKTGYLNYRIAIGNSDTSGMVIRMIASAGTVTDADGNVYKTVRIGNQEWMAENLRTTKYNDGSSIPNIIRDTTWDSCYYTPTGAYCYNYNTTDSGRIERFGALYNWYAVNTGKLAPAGWHVPTDAEWDTLQNYLIANGYNYNGTTTENKIAKSMAANIDWAVSKDEWVGGGAICKDLSTNNKSGFSALPGGSRYSNGDPFFCDFEAWGNYGRWWSATEFDASDAWYRFLLYVNESLHRYHSIKSCGYSVRLLRD
jgi:uncharacterized protein (TIGR02145 family)